MSDYTDKLGNRLNDLLEKNYDAEEGFKKASENAKHAGLKSYFSNKAKERYNYGHELKSELKNFGQEPDKGGSVTGAAHRTWMEVKSWFSTDDDEAMLEEAIRGEKASVDEYNEVLKETALPTSTQQVLERQKNAIEHGLTNIKRLEDLS
ncbi:ferritin-like domain-containing protein [Gelidibacter maritimus]|uniref:PA2169 family four-helix-bundle protein n=1 Tax=Gelidibacter maritimus TaxID=2761487 RepID=A0A7W2R432_9FLAO|nr:PA2169 family four-helix-bundle protein [Gelidibacter maritimus]MBA6152635.1 PA2169 family four-helix-bundle protein [Gelidibacter maritimus]